MLVLEFGEIGDDEVRGVVLDDEIGVKAMSGCGVERMDSSSQNGKWSGGSVEDRRMQCSCLLESNVN